MQKAVQLRTRETAREPLHSVLPKFTPLFSNLFFLASRRQSQKNERLFSVVKAQQRAMTKQRDRWSFELGNLRLCSTEDASRQSQPTAPIHPSVHLLLACSSSFRRASFFFFFFFLLGPFSSSLCQWDPSGTSPIHLLPNKPAHISFPRIFDSNIAPSENPCTDPRSLTRTHRATPLRTNHLLLDTSSQQQSHRKKNERTKERADHRGNYEQILIERSRIVIVDGNRTNAMRSMSCEMGKRDQKL